MNLKKIFFDDPARIFFVSSSFILVLIILPFYTLKDEYKFSSYLFIFICYFSAFLGLKIGNLEFKKNFIKKETISLKIFNKILLITTLISVIGIILTTYEYFVVRGLRFTLDISQNKIAWFKSNTSVLSMLASLFETFSIFLLPIFLQKYHRFKDRKFLFSSTLIFFIHLSFGILLGSRVVILLSVIIIFLSYLFYFQIKLKYLLTFLVFFIFLFGYIFDLRVKGYGYSIFDSLYYSGYSFLLSPNNDYFDNEFSKSFFLTSLYSLYMYLIHGFYEMSYILEKSFIYYDYGKNLLWLPLKVINTIFGMEIEPSLDSLRGGVYQTFIATFFRDFKYYSPLFIFIIFFLIAYPFKKLKNGNESWFFVVVILSLWLLSSPFFSPFGSGPFTYCLTISLIIKLIFLYYSRKENKN